MATPKIHAMFPVFLALLLHLSAQIPPTCSADTILTVEQLYFSSVFTSSPAFVAYDQITLSITSPPATVILTTYVTEPCSGYNTMQVEGLTMRIYADCLEMEPDHIRFQVVVCITLPFAAQLISF
jgi:hypothetical protein